MGPKKKEEAPPPEPEELLPKGYSVGCEVYWTACATCLGDHGGVVKTGWKGMLVAVPGILTHEDEEGEKTYSLEEVEVQWPWPFEASRVPLTSLGLKQPPLAAMWNLKPSFGSKSIELTPFASSSLGSTSPSGKTCNGTMADMKARATGPFMEAIFKLQSYPCRSDKVEDLLEPALVEYLNSEEVAAGSTSFGLHTGHEGYVDWRAIFKWVSEVVTGANLYAKLSPELCLDEETYPSIVRRFDRQGGRFISDCPKSENILPFAKFVVTLLYLELKEADRLRAEREQQLKEVLEAEAPQDGDPRASVLWDTEDDLDLHIQLPDTHGEFNVRHHLTRDGADAAAEQKDGAEQAYIRRPVESAWFPLYVPTATGKDAVLCPPLGDYKVWLQMSSRRSKDPCHWACQVVTGGKPEILCGTWNDGDADIIEISSFTFSEPE
eukprot:TRINITY_DN22649_c0_g1_i2.p1 TRINITY_DN22649_c0_g1~~TRINITY_DN22649_c0_g1_i2.p1  ORF type:complete len:436 (+),score=74.29 TRINITY_DN22649_c0_g1_i2:86-1393(+)